MMRVHDPLLRRGGRQRKSKMILAISFIQGGKRVLVKKQQKANISGIFVRRMQRREAVENKGQHLAALCRVSLFHGKEQMLVVNEILEVACALA
jgi:hypothetical protein